MANDTENGSTGKDEAVSESGTTLSSDAILHPGLLDAKDQHLAKAHDYHLDQDMGESMEQVNANLHLGGEPATPDHGLLEETATGTFAAETADLPFAENESGTASVSDEGLERTVSVPTVPEDDKSGSNSGAEPVGTSSSVPAEQLTVEAVQNPRFSGLESQEPAASAGTATVEVPSGSSPEEIASVDDGPIASELTSIADSDASDDEVDENAELGAKTGITAHSDVTEGATVTYSLLDDAGGLFSIDPETGIVSVAGDLNAETAVSHEIVVLATASDGATQTETFAISIRDIDEYDVSALTMAGDTGDGISEDIAGGSAVGIAVSADDRDVSDSVTYSVDDARFQIDENGVVTIADGAVFDAESEGTVSFTVTATSTDGSQSSQTFDLTVADVNEHDVSEVSDADTSANTIAENAAAGTQVGITALAADADATDTISYSVSDSRFAVVADGVVTVTSGASFDYESEPTINLTVTATSSDGSTSQEAFAISVSDVVESYQMSDGQGSFTDDGTAEQSILGTSGAETITAHDDGSAIYSGSGDDTIHGGDGNDTIIYGEGADTVYGGAGNDFIDDARGAQISNHANYLDGGAGSDTIYGGGGDDTILGGDGKDALYGEGDNDWIDGGAGDDRIYGDRGDDTLIGGAGNDRLDGGSGQDHAIYTGNRSDYTITESSGIFTIIDNRDGSPDGTDTVTDVESFTFADGSIAAGDLIAEDVSAVSDTDSADNTIAENAAAGTQVGITAFAEDGNTSDTVTYSVSDSRFTVDANGVVTVASGATFDAETEGSIDITVTATSTDDSTSAETFTIAVSDIDEYDVSAVSDTDTSANTIAENATAGTQVGITALAADADATDSVTYSVSDSRFTVDANGVVTVASGASFDAETEGSIDVTVMATSTDGSTSSETFTIAVSDINEYDVSTVSDTDSTVNAIAESATAGSRVGIAAQAMDADVTDAVSYAVSDSRFSVDAEGVVTVASGASFDYESEPTISLTVTATSSDGSTSSETFSVDVSDIAENIVLTSGDDDFEDTGVTELSIDAGAGNDYVYGGDGNNNINGGDGEDLLMSGDGDDVLSGGADDDVLIAGAGNDTLDGGQGDDFLIGLEGDDTIDGGDGSDYVYYDANRSDYTITESGGVYTVVDNRPGSPEGTDTVTNVERFAFADGIVLAGDLIAEDVSAVSDTDTTANTIAENAAAGTAVGITTFAEDGNTSDTVTYSVSDSRFTVDANGVVTVASGASFDAETEGSIDVTVTATSTDGSTSSETFTIAVSDIDEYDVSAVSDTDTSANTIAENAAAGTQVGITALAADGDATDTVSYAVSDSRFTVNPNGVVTVASGATFDAETEGSIDVTVTATSTDGSTSSETFTIAVSDIDEYDVSAVSDTDNTANTIAENAAAGTQVGISALATDADVTDAVSYAVSDSRFTVNPNGVVTVASGATFDAETEGSIDVTVTATSTDGSTSSETFTIAVSDIDEYDVSAVSDTDNTANTIAENATAGTQVGITALAADADATDSVTYTVSDSRFTVNPNGVVTVASSATFDAETEGSIDITVTATSSDGSTSSETFTIAVSDIDEYDVSAVSDTDSTANTITENASAGSQVGITAQATDADVTDAVSYAVSDSRFTVDANGVVTVASGASFDAETEGSIDITVTATSTDGSSSSQIFTVGVSQGQAQISSVTDSNSAANSIGENAWAGMQVGITASANDPNESDTVSYSVSDSRFTVDADGVVTVASGATFDYETEPTIDLTVTATSSDGSTSQEIFAISVSDVAEAYQMVDGQRAFTDTGVAESSITGTGGAETITAHDDGSTIYSGAGDDTIHGGAGNDLIFFGEGADTVYGGDGDDIIDDQSGTQISTQANYIDGGSGNDRIFSGGGDDVIVGGDGYDSLYGEDGNDTIDGGATDDWIYGGQGDDTLIGGTGNDTLYGEDGSDLFMYGLGDGSDVIHGGEGTAWTDAINLGGSSGTASAGDYGSDWTVTITSGSIINTDTATNEMELSQDADGYIDFSDGSRVTFSDVEEIRW